MTNDSGYSSIAESASVSASLPSPAPGSVSQRKLRQPEPDRNIPGEARPTPTSADLEKIEEKISEIFDSMNIGNSINNTPSIQWLTIRNSFRNG